MIPNNKNISFIKLLTSNRESLPAKQNSTAPFNKIESLNGDGFSLNNREVTCNFSGEVIIHTKLGFDKTDGENYIYIYKNSVRQTLNYSKSSWLEEHRLMHVEKGDKLNIHCYSATNNQIGEPETNRINASFFQIYRIL